MNFTYDGVGDRISARLKELSFKQTDLSDKTGLSTTAISQYCTGRRVPDTASLHKISQALKVSMEWILTGEDITTEDFSRAALQEFKASQGLLCDDSPLNDFETDVIAMLRLLTDEHRQEVFDIVYLKYKRISERGKESIYSTYFADSCLEESNLENDLNSHYDMA